VVTCTGVSKAVASEIFDSDEQCFISAFDDSLARLSHVITGAVAREAGWLERVRVGVVALLGFFDDEPQRARLLVLDAPVSAATGLECRRRLHGMLATLIDASHGASATDDARIGGDARAASRGAVAVADGTGTPPGLTSELVVGGVFSVIRTSLLEGDGAKLVELAPSLMGFIVAPYLGQTAARLELEGRPARRGRTIPQDTALACASEPTRAAAIARTSELPIRVTHRTTLVLHAIERTPYANNREIARAAGITDEGQASKLLARLERRGVIENVGVGPARGEPNAWLLTPSGRRAIDLISGRFASGAPRPRGSRAEDVA
jgi:hypothetical protein